MLPPRPSCLELKGLNVKKAIRQWHSELRINPFLLCVHWMSDKMVASKLSPAQASKKLKPAESEQRHLISLFLSLFPFFLIFLVHPSLSPPPPLPSHFFPSFNSFFPLPSEKGQRDPKRIPRNHWYTFARRKWWIRVGLRVVSSRSLPSSSLRPAKHPFPKSVEGPSFPSLCLD